MNNLRELHAIIFSRIETILENEHNISYFDLFTDEQDLLIKALDYVVHYSREKADIHFCVDDEYCRFYAEYNGVRDGAFYMLHIIDGFVSHCAGFGFYEDGEIGDCYYTINNNAILIDPTLINNHVDLWNILRM